MSVLGGWGVGGGGIRKGGIKENTLTGGGGGRSDVQSNFHEALWSKDYRFHIFINNVKLDTRE